MCMCALWGLSSAVYKCLLITTFNFKARAHRTSRGRETVVSAILNIVADTRTETGAHTHTHTCAHAHAFTHITGCGTYTGVRALAGNFSGSGPGSGPHCLLNARLRGQSIYLLHSQAWAVPKTPVLSTRVPTCASNNLPPSTRHSPLPFSIATCLLPYGGSAHKSHAHHIIIQSTGAKQPSSEWIWSVLSGRCMSAVATPTKLSQLGLKLFVYSSVEINNNLPRRNA